MQWRVDNKVDKLLNAELDPALSVNFPYFLDGVDKKGRPGILKVLAMSYHKSEQLTPYQTHNLYKF